MEKKKWYQSKIVLICLTAIATIGGNYLTGFITGQGVTDQQIQAVSAVDPAVADLVAKIQNGENWFSAVGTLVFAAVGIIRVWFTQKLIA